MINPFKGFSIKRFFLIGFTALATPVTLIWIVMVQPTFTENQPSSTAIDPIRLKKHVIILSEDFHPRNWREVENLNRCADYIYAHFKNSNAGTSFQECEARENVYKNVIGLYGPPSDHRIIIGAHYDTSGDTPGADDNASGVAALIELGYLFGREKPAKTIELVAYPLEEPPFFGTKSMGSSVHGDSLMERGIKVELMIALECIGYFSDQEESQMFPSPLLRLFYPGQGNFITLVGHISQRRIVKQLKKYMKGVNDLPVYSINAPLFIPGVDFSDHRNYWEHGINAVMITDTAFYRNLEYHEQGDTADRLDYDRLSKVVVQVYEGIKGLMND